MTTLYAPMVDWIDCKWGGPFDDDEEEEFPSGPCCSNDLQKHIFLPVFGPVNKDGVPLGYLLVPQLL
jgi:hypothetical protein